MNIKTKNILIRICYIIPFLLFTYTFIDERFLVDERFRKVDLWIVISMIVFFYQSIRNSILGWLSSMILYLIFLFMISKGIFSSIEDLGAKIDMQGFIVQCLLIFMYLGLGFLYWKIRPKERLI